jgi:FKBP-type peptidyl-prolyl cis-trans isomerase (trigger factor)
MFGKKPATRPSGSEPAARTTVSDAGPCQKSVKLRVGADAIAPIRAAVLAEFQKEATLPGFRKGKAPADLVERQHGKSIHDEMLQRAMRQAIEQAAKEHQLRPVGPFQVRAADFKDAEGLTLEALVEVEPTFALGDYKGLHVPAGSDSVTPEELTKALAGLQESMAEMAPGAEGETKEKRVPPLDDELAKDLGLESLQKLKEHVEAKLREQKRADQARAREAAISEELIKRHSFALPVSLVEHQTDRLARDFKVRLLMSGVAEAKIDEEMAKFTEQLRQAGERHVRLSFILDRIAEKESVTVTQDELVGRLWQVSQRWKKDPAEVRKIFDAQGLWGSVVSAIRQEKTMAFLLSNAVTQNGGPGA